MDLWKLSLASSDQKFAVIDSYEITLVQNTTELVDDPIVILIGNLR